MAKPRCKNLTPDMTWLKMKSELVGKDYEPEPYTAYLAAKEDGYDPSNL